MQAEFVGNVVGVPCYGGYRRGKRCSCLDQTYQEGGLAMLHLCIGIIKWLSGILGILREFRECRH